VSSGGSHGKLPHGAHSTPTAIQPCAHDAHLGPARSAAHVAVAFRWMTPPGQLTSPLAHRQKIAKRSPPSFVARKSSSSDDQNPDNAYGRSSPPPQLAPYGHGSQPRPPCRGHSGNHAPGAQTQREGVIEAVAEVVVCARPASSVHDSHAVPPSLLAYVPSGHASQRSLPSPSAKCPLLQGAHASRASLECGLW
jgi:hypothetical protein